MSTPFERALVLHMGVIGCAGMIAADIPWWLKLWWKGVDIGANALSGAVVAILALIFWRLQQVWLRRLGKRHQKEDAMERRRARLALLHTEKQALLNQAEHQRDIVHPQPAACEVLVGEYLSWMERSGLKNHSDNWEKYDRWTGQGPVAHVTLHGVRASLLVSGALDKLVTDICGTQLPGIDQSDFPW